MSKKPYKEVYLDSGIEVLNNFELLNHINESDLFTKIDCHVALSLAIRRNSVFGCSFPSKSTVSKNTGLSISAIKRSIKKLVDKGLIICINEGYSGGAHNGVSKNLYYFYFDFSYFCGLVDSQEEHPIHKEEPYFESFEIARDEYNRLKDGGT